MPAACNHEKRLAGTRRVHVVTTTPARSNKRAHIYTRAPTHTDA